MRCNDIWRNYEGEFYPSDPVWGTEGNFTANPMYCNPDAGDFTLDAASPCLPGHHPYGDDCGLIGAFGQGCGATAVQSGTWGSLKQLFR